MTNCKVQGCRYSTSHSTDAHQCGKCHQFGHGQIECGNSQKMKRLEKYFTNYVSENILTENSLATFCPINIIKNFVPSGTFVEVYGGMGSTIYVRNSGNYFQGICIGNQDWAYNPALIAEKDEFLRGYSQTNLTNYEQAQICGRNTL